MLPVTRLSLRNQAKDRADMGDDSDYVSDDEWNHYANYALGELYDLIIRIDDTSVVSSTVTPSVPGQSVYTLPADFFKMSRIYEQGPGNRLLSLDSLSAHDLSQPYFHDEVWLSTRGDSRYRYYIEGLTFEVRPIPTGNINFLIKYVPQLQYLMNDASVISYPIVPGWEEYIVIGMAMRALSKEDTRVQALAVERSRYEDRLIRMAGDKDRFSPKRIRDVYGANRFNYRFPSTQR